MKPSIIRKFEEQERVFGDAARKRRNKSKKKADRTIAIRKAIAEMERK